MQWGPMRQPAAARGNGLLEENNRSAMRLSCVDFDRRFVFFVLTVGLVSGARYSRPRNTSFQMRIKLSAIPRMGCALLSASPCSWNLISNVR